MKSFAGLAVLFVFAAGMPMPETGSIPSNAVPFETVKKVALVWAATEFPGARLGTAIPHVDENGNTVAWMFHFRTDGAAFPDYEQVAADVQAERATLTFNTDLSRWRSRYAHMLVSARTDRAPVVCFGYGASGYYAIAEKALARAQGAIGSDARLSRMYFVCPATYLEFENGAGAHVVYSEHFERTWGSREGFAGYVCGEKARLAREFPADEARTAARHQLEWNRAFSHEPGRFSEVFVPGYQLAPFYDWSYGCTPTAGAMVCGYVDRFQKSGRLVEWFWQRRDNVEGENDWQIPNVQRECAIEMGTDTSYGGTSIYAIANGLAQVSANDNYYWSVTNEMGAEWNDWAWATLTAEIDAGHAMIWSALWEVHSLACFGYRTDDQFVYVHNTWWRPAEWWTHSGNDWAHVAAVTPDAGDEHNLRITYPLGDTFYNSTGRGEVLYVGDTVRVTWENGLAADHVEIDLSSDGGKTWDNIVADAADSGAYHWYIPPSVASGDSYRLRLAQYVGTTLASGDGSYGCFHILREPLPPPQVSPPNGLPVRSLPIVLVVDSVRANCDSFGYKLVQGVDTIWREFSTSPRCALPDSLLQNNKTYKWQVRGRNQWGWGEWSTMWSFRTFFGAVEEAKRAAPPLLSVPGVARVAGPGLDFQVGAAGPRARLELFDALGNVVREMAVSGPGRITWDLRDAAGIRVAPGLYFVRLAGGTAAPTRKLVLLD